ncbi:MAG: M1 family metallopeptidase, partial [Gammaproteobacteria bacterium]
AVSGSICAAGHPVPRGQLPSGVTPTAYSLDLSIQPEASDFAGNARIEIELSKPLKAFYLHGADLRVDRVEIEQGDATIAASYRQVDASGVARIEAAKPLQKGPARLRIDYRAAFSTGAAGLYHIQANGDWYAFTQMEPTDARRMFPGFDEPRFKTPFTLTVRTGAGNQVIANAPESAAPSSEAGLQVHRFAATKPLPTYLIALAIGPLDVVSAPPLAPNAVRKYSLSLRGVATRGQGHRLTFALAHTNDIVSRLETYFNRAYPYEKLDIIASPGMQGAMENAGAIIYGDTLLLMDSDAPLSQKRSYGVVHAHELAHQWFGDLVTPVWWDDIWLNESFASWMGRKIASAWRPGYGLEKQTLEAGIGAFEADQRSANRPIRQRIDDFSQIASTFDGITYQKGGQVLSMFESFIGVQAFQQGVQLHMQRFPYANASADDFLRSLADGSGRADIIPAFRSFIDLPGVPVLDVQIDCSEPGQPALQVSQSRYAVLGREFPDAPLWQVPMCAHLSGGGRQCAMITERKQEVPLDTSTCPAWVLPNADGAGYYRFALDRSHWQALLAEFATLPAREALIAADSLWAAYRRNQIDTETLMQAAESLAGHADNDVATAMIDRLVEIKRKLLQPGQRADFARRLQAIYRPRLEKLQFNVADAGNSETDGAAVGLRAELVELLALEADDADLRRLLCDAAVAYLDGERKAVAPEFLVTALAVGVQEQPKRFVADLSRTLVTSTVPLERSSAARALGAADKPEQGEQVRALALGAGIRVQELFGILYGQLRQPTQKAATYAWVKANFEGIAAKLPGFVQRRMYALPGDLCDAALARDAEAFFAPRAKAAGVGRLELAQALEDNQSCIALAVAKRDEFDALVR